MTEKILIFRTGHLGDTIVALPAFWAIRKKFVNTHITLLTNQDRRRPNYLSPSSVLPERGLVDSYESYPTGLNAVRTATGLASLAIRLRRSKIGQVFYLMPRLRSQTQIERDAQFFRWSGIAKIHCLDHFAQNRLDFPPKPPLRDLQPEFQFLLDCLASEGVTGSPDDHSLALTDAEIAAAAEWLARQRPPAGSSLVAVAPGTKFASKMWPEERYRETLAALIERHDIFPIIFGGPEDAPKGERLIASLGRGANAAGALTVRTSAALIARCALYVGNDTGTMHMAAAVGVPCVAIFAAVDWPGRWVPFGDRNIIFRTVVPCEGCYSPDCPNDLLCLRAIESTGVIEKCSEILGGIG